MSVHRALPRAARFREAPAGSLAGVCVHAPPTSRKNPLLLLNFCFMPTLLQIVGLLFFLFLWGTAWRRQPNLAIGMFAGVLIAALAVTLCRLYLDTRHVPIWLAPLPIATIAVSLLGFGTWAWVLGRRGSRRES